MDNKRPAFIGNWKYYIKIVSGLVLGYSFWFCILIFLLRWVNPPFSSFTLQEDWDALGASRYNLRESWVASEQLPDHLKLAVIASEDQRFYSHIGIDLDAIEQAIEDNEQSKRLRGASTITQQVAKNLFLSPAQSYLRKGIEAGIAILIDLMWPKDRILEVYLNIAEFGPGMYGISVASQHYYGKQPAMLKPKEAARMATVLPNPKLIEPEPASDYVLKRSKWILRNMQQLSGVRYLPEAEPERVDTLPLPVINFDSLQVVPAVDTLGDYLDSLLIELQTDTVAYQ